MSGSESEGDRETFEEEDELAVIDANQNSDFSFQPSKERKTTPFLTKYERARVIGTRALQISMRAPVMVELEGEMDPIEIALKELKQKKIPLIIRRYLPDGRYEDWRVEELSYV
eukprot:TRINITY_DN102_c3_g1_i1.p1 TRINITY_DN102_c3_g1~~TRINITY_DN102_c3_g1_i1.p1  ORF type:complete len:114 (+),score=56.30 TRINITY_DN102_c3_g1_i1:103-444(+)